MSLRQPLNVLTSSTPEALPPLCNVYVTILERPERVLDRGGRWQMKVSGLSSHESEAFICVHDQPSESGLRLGYEVTSTALLELFKKDVYKRLFQPGEAVLVQAVPRFGAGGLYLNVPHVMIVRPFQTFGRTQIDSVTSCPRKSYLTLLKGVSRKRHAEPLTGASLGGELAHEVFAHAAVSRDNAPANADDFLCRSMSERVLARLVHVGRRDPSAIRFAVERARSTLVLLRSTRAVRDLLEADEWSPESEQLNNGVGVSPDLLGRKRLVELKTVSPTSRYYDESAMMHQVDTYLSWAMVEFGVDEVARKWKGYLVQLHSEVPEEQRVREVAPRVGTLAERIRKRHQLLSVSAGAWLPRPQAGECNRCEFGTLGGYRDGQSPPCTFHCQMERHWDCERPDGPCPLIDTCDEYSRYVEFYNIDRYHAARRVILEEERERGFVRRLLEGLGETAVAEKVGLLYSKLTVVEHRNRNLQLKFPARLEALQLGPTGLRFRVESEHRLPFEAMLVGHARGVVTLRDLSTPHTGLEAGTSVSLRPMVETDIEMRDMLKHLEQRQRELGGVFEAARLPEGSDAGAHGDVVVRTHDSLDAIERDSQLVLIDAPSAETQRAVLEELGRREAAPWVLVASGNRPVSIPGAMDLREGPLMDQFHELRASKFDIRLNRLASEAQMAKALVLSREYLADRLAHEAASTRKPFTAVVVTEAESLSMLALDRCFELAQRVILVGQAAAAGPKVANASSRSSPLFQNLLRFAIETAKTSFAGRVSAVDVVRLAPGRAAYASRDLGVNFATEGIPVVWHVGPSAFEPVAQTAGVRMEVSVERTGQDVRARHVELKWTDVGELSTSTLELTLKGITGRSIESLDIMHECSEDASRLIGRRGSVTSVRPSPRVTDPCHRVSVTLPSNAFPAVQERLFQNEPEATALIGFAAQQMDHSWVATSPFAAQSHLIAWKLHERKLRNVRVVPLDSLGEIDWSKEDGLLFSAVVESAGPSFSFPFPMNEPAQLLPILVGPQRELHVFCSDAARRTHPVLRLLDRVTHSENQ